MEIRSYSQIRPNTQGINLIHDFLPHCNLDDLELVIGSSLFRLDSESKSTSTIAYSSEELLSDVDELQ